MENKIIIALDCMGGDYAPQSVIEGIDYLDSNIKKDLFFLLYGDQIKINKYFFKYPEVKKISKLIHTDT